MVKQPIGRSVAIVFGFWWLVLTAWGLWSWSPSTQSVRGVAVIMVASLAIPLLAAIAGFVGGLAATSGRAFLRRDELARGSAAGGAFVSIGALPHAPSMARGEVTDADLTRIPNWSAYAKAFPVHAAAVRGVMAVMKAEANLPASPVPGGHGGRTLIEHSIGVVESMNKIAPRWVYEGQKNKSGKIVRPTNEGPHRFTPQDYGLLVLTAFAHDIGKVACYKLQPDGKVREVLPNHDTEGAKVLRRIPEVMALPFEDRRALITAIAFYHHPFAIPDAPWVSDRIRSLMELLIKADHATGRAEGHTLTNYALNDDDGDTAAPFVQTYQSPSSVIDKVMASLENVGSHKTIFDMADAEDEAVVQALGGESGIAERQAKAAAETHRHLDEISEIAGDSREIRLLADALKKDRIQINAKNTNLRLGFKKDGMLYLSEPRLRSTIASLPMTRLAEAGVFAHDLLDGNNAPGMRINAFTAKLLDALASKDLLVTTATMEGKEGKVSTRNAQWVIATKINKKELSSQVGGGFIMIPAAPFGQDMITDWPHPIAVVKPLFGMNALLNKKAKAAEGTVPFDAELPEASAPAAEVDGAEEEDDGLFDPMDAVAEAKVDPAVLGPMVLADIRQALAESELEPARQNGSGSYFKTDGTAGSLIATKLAEAGLSPDQAGIWSRTGESGATYYVIPPEAQTDDE